MMRDTLADHAKEPLTLALAGLGITFAPYEWIGGLFLALTGRNCSYPIPEREGQVTLLQNTPPEKTLA